MTQKTKSTIKRFVKGLIGAFAAGAVTIPFQNFDSVESYLNALLVAGIAGVLLALEKNLNWID